MVACQIPLEEMNRSVLSFLFHVLLISEVDFLKYFFLQIIEGIEESNWEEKKATGFVFWSS